MNKVQQVVDEKFIKQKTIKGIIVFVLFIVACLFAWNRLQHQPKESGALIPLRKGLDMNETGAFWSVPIAETGIALMAWYYFKKGKWKTVEV